MWKEPIATVVFKPGANHNNSVKRVDCRCVEHPLQVILMKPEEQRLCGNLC